MQTHMNSHDAWTLTYDTWDPAQQPLREELCTLGNGYFATRGAAEEVKAGGPHYPGTYLAGGYNQLESEVSGRIIENEDLVNWPNWLCLSFRLEGGDWLHISPADLLNFQQSLDLRRVVHSWVLARSDREGAWQLFRHALESDVVDIQGGTTAEGIHLGAMAGTVDIIQRCHTGVEVRNDILWLNPCLPKELQEIRLRIRYRGHWLRLHVTHTTLAVACEHGWSGSVKIGFRESVHTFAQGEKKTFAL